MSDSLSVDETATQCFTLWTASRLLSTFRDHKQKQTEVSKQVLLLCLAGIKVNQRSVYLSNNKMMETLEFYDEWSPFILTGNVGLHMKFKTNAGILAHIINCINSYQEDEAKMKELNQKIDSTTDQYKNLNDMLESGMLPRSLSLCC